MEEDTAINRARREAIKNGVTVAVVDAPIENAEQSGTWGYCPLVAVKTLFKFATVKYHVSPDGAVRKV